MGCIVGREEKHILDYGYRCVLYPEKESKKMQARNYLIEGDRLVEVKLCHIGNKATYVAVGNQTTFKKVQKKIRLVFDQQGVLIARRASPIAPLRLTCKGMGRLVSKEIMV